MTKEWKIAVVVSGIVLFLCSIACISVYVIGKYTLPKTISSQPERSAEIGHEIVDYTLPSGYREMLGVSMLGTKWVVIGNDKPDALMIMMMQFPSDADITQEEMQQEMAQALAQQGQQGTTSFQVVETQTVTIKGNEIILTISETDSEYDRPLRRVAGVFPGKTGAVMLMAMGEIDTWDQVALDAFIASIR